MNYCPRCSGDVYEHVPGAGLSIDLTCIDSNKLGCNYNICLDRNYDGSIKYYAYVEVFDSKKYTTYYFECESSIDFGDKTVISTSDGLFIKKYDATIDFTNKTDSMLLNIMKYDNF